MADINMTEADLLRKRQRATLTVQQEAPPY